MKTLTDYTEAKQTKLFNTTGAFFAFSNKQLDEKKVEGVKYVSLFAGLICPHDTAKVLIDGLARINKEGISQDIAENGKPAIIHRELANHEAQITNDIEDTVDALKGYNIPSEMVQAEYGAFFQHCVDNGYF